MPYFFTNNARSSLQSTPTLFDTATLGMVLFHSAPRFQQDDPRYADITTADDLAQELGWEEVNVEGYPLTEEVSVTAQVDEWAESKNKRIILDEFPLDEELAPVQVRAIGYYLKGTMGGVTNGLILVTNDPVSPVRTLRGGDFIACRPDTTATGGPEGTNQWLMGWEVANPGVSLIQGPLSTMKAAPEFEPAHTQHVWLYPQRVNLIANPNFEAGTNHWRSNGVIALGDSGTTHVGVFTSGPGGLQIAESNRFPALNTQWTVQLTAKGEGSLKVGLVAWPVEYNETIVDWGDIAEKWDLSPSGFKHIQCLRSTYQSYECMVRLEFQGPDLSIDRVLCEPTYLINDPHWDYFDGDTTFGARDDFSWYGGENLKGKTYSCWYNNRRATAGRLFATKFPNRATLTSDEELQDGLVYRWVPAGVVVEPHWDVLFEGDLQHRVADPYGSPVTPYKVAAHGSQEWARDMGVQSPWPAS